LRIENERLGDRRFAAALRERNQQLEAFVLQLTEQLHSKDDQLQAASIPRVDYKQIRLQVLQSLAKGKSGVATTSPQYKTASKTLDRFIEAIESTSASAPVSIAEEKE